MQDKFSSIERKIETLNKEHSTKVHNSPHKITCKLDTAFPIDSFDLSIV